MDQDERIERLEKRIENLERLILQNFHILSGVKSFNENITNYFKGGRKEQYAETGGTIFND